MADDGEPDLKLEIAHVLTIDVVAYSTLLIHEQSRVMAELTRVVRGTPCFRTAEAEGKLTRLPTGDGMALVFFGNPEAPIECAMQISAELKDSPTIRLRMGVHSGPINQIVDVNDRINVAGSGIDTAQRVMDCGDTGHILLSKRVAEDLAAYPRWHPFLHDLGECEVKHGRKISVFNFYDGSVGNPERPSKWPAAVSTEPPAPAARRSVLPYLAAMLILLACVAAAFSWLTRTAKANAQSVAVLPFSDSSQLKDQEYLADGITEMITIALGKISGLFVPGRTSALAFKNAQRNLKEIGRQLRVAHVLEGSVNRDGGKIRVDITLVDVESGYQAWAESYDATDQNILTLQRDIAAKVAQALRVRLQGGEQNQLAKVPTQDAEAYDLYLRGRYLLNRRNAESLQRARSLFEQAVARDPDFALGHTGIADSFIALGKIGAITGDEAAAQAWPQVMAALATDDQLAQTYVSRAILLNDYEWNWPAAEADYRKALELDPNNAGAHHWYARHQAQLGKFDSALEQIDAAQRQDPLSAPIRVTKGKILFEARRFNEAVAPCEQALELDPNFASAFSVLGATQVHRGDFARGIEAARTYVARSDRSGWAQLELAYAYTVAGQPAEADRIADEVVEHSSQYSPFDMAAIRAAQGNAAEALDWLARAITERSVDVIWMRVDPRLDPVRADPGFAKLVKRIEPRR
ncbi:MAG: tetratricopeptide repeat protein [Verrucomicrobiota bacterium]|nr:tetratricopeptide repeat protein [Verrucomicrobiota bacterium]